MAVAARTSHQAVRGYRDHAGRNSSVRFNITDTVWAAYGTDTTAGALFDLFAAIDDLSLDNPTLGRAAKYFDETGLTSVSPTDENAVNSAKLLVLFQDLTTGDKFSMQIPARDAAHYSSVRGEVILSGAGVTAEVTEFVTQANATVKSEDLNTSEIYQIRVIGKGTAA